MESCMMFGQEHDCSTATVNKMLNRKNIWMIFIVATAVVISSYLIYLNIEKQRVLEELKDLAPIVFSAGFYNGDYGTFKYYPSSGKIEKISDLQLHSLSYSEDRSKIIGIVFGGIVDGIVEINLSDNSVKQIISIEDINKQLDKIGVRPKERYRHLDDVLTFPKYYKDGYVFIFKENVYFLQDKQGDFSITQINNTYTINAYFIDKEDRLYLKKENGDIVLDENAKEESHILLHTEEDLYIDEGSSLFDMSNNKKEILYYDLGNVNIYNTELSQNTATIKHFSIYQYILDLRLSENNKYVFYTLGELYSMNLNEYRYNFYIVDPKRKIRIHLKRFNNGDDFYGFDW